jgi:8-oxo-dGTP pyrophosphatase MutT (NUDIX family)
MPERIIPQAACVPFRLIGGGVEILLIRRTDEELWGIPKGMIDDGNTARQTAIIEAFEEAGLRGDLLDKDLGMFDYTKSGRHCRVRVYALHVREELAEYDEKGYRERRWFSAEAAPERAERDAVKEMIRLLIDRARWLAG